MRHSTLLFFLLLLTPALAGPPIDDALRSEIAKLIQSLGSDQYVTREAAFESLRLIGADATTQLEVAVKDDDPEIARLAERLLLEIRHRDSGGLLDALEIRDDSFRDSPEFHAMVARGREFLPELYRVLDEEEAGYPQYSYYRMRNAFAVIAELAVDTDIDILLGRLDSPNIQNRIMVEPILKTFDRDLVKRKVIELLSDPDAPPRARAQCIEMCVNTSFSRNDSDIERAIRNLLGDGEELVRAAALRHAGFRRSDEVYPRIVELADDESALVRSAALRAMRYYRKPESEPVLRRALRDPEPEVRAAAIETLRGTGGPDIAPLIRPFLKDPDPLVRSNAAQTLSQFGDRAALPVLIESLEFRDEEFLTRTLSSVLQALGRIGDRSALEPLFSLLEDSAQFDRIRSYRYLILRAIVAIGGAPVLKRIRPLLMDPDLQNIHVVLDALGRVDSDDVIPILIAALDRKETYVRTSAVRSLGARGYRPAAPLILALIGKEEDPWFLSEAVKALAIMGSTQSLPAIRKLFDLDLTDSRFASLAYSLIRASIRLGAKDLAPRILDLAESSSSYSYISIDAAGALGNKEVVPRLLEIRKDETSDGRRFRIDLALARLGRTEFMAKRYDDLLPLETDPHSRSRRIGMLLAMGRLDEARVLVDEGLAADPDNPSHLHDLARLHALGGRPDAALEALRKSLEERPLSRDVLFSDSYLAPLFDLPGFQELLKKAR